MNSGLALDTWELMPHALARGRLSQYELPFEIRKGQLVLTDAHRPGRSGLIDMCIDWPRNSRRPANGVAVISHRSWQIPRIVMILGEPAESSGERSWKFLCPINRTLHQVLFLDSVSELFVSKTARGREQRRADFVRATEYFEMMATIEDAQTKLKPGLTKSPLIEGIIQAMPTAMESADLRFRLAVSGFPDVVFDDNGSINVMAMVKQSASRRGSSQAARGAYTRNKSNNLTLSREAKKLFGLR
ncbi:hypothetical protein ACWX0K_16515 [Nitrobacteraceae bacterium UC4446_H13]